jgi:hypothetical protein
MADSRPGRGDAMRSTDALSRLVRQYYEALAADVHKERDCHWQIAERWSYGEPVGWFVEHDGYCYEGLDADYGEDGPHPSRAEAERCMAEHLRAAIASVQGWHGG